MTKYFVMLLIIIISVVAVTLTFMVVANLYHRIQIKPLPTVSYPRVLDVPQRIVYECWHRGFPSYFALRLAWRESNWIPNIVSPTHDHGVFQINEGSLSAMGITKQEALMPSKSIPVAIAWLVKWKQQCRSLAEVDFAWGNGRCR